MAKTSSIQRNLKRIRMVERYAAKRAALKSIMADPNTSEEDFFLAQKKLAKMPRNSSAVRIRNRCSATGRSRAYLRKFGVSRITFRELASKGHVPGVTKSSW